MVALSKLIPNLPPAIPQLSERLADVFGLAPVIATPTPNPISSGFVPTGRIGKTMADSHVNDRLTLTGSVDVGEKCPACQSRILLDHISTAVCTKGHSWGKSTDRAIPKGNAPLAH
jgi:hypothetical protein